MSRAAPRVPDVLAAVDLGSNSFHMVVARHTDGQLVILDRLREMVRLAAGIDEDGRLDREVAARALACLERFGQRLCATCMPTACAWSAPTRCASRAVTQSFLERAREAIGHPIEIVSGIEEARLIYSGVAHTMPDEPGRRLVVDIGGGSTEIIIGEGLEPLELESLQIGCVSMSARHFGDGKLSAKRIAARAARRAPGTRTDPGGLPAARLGQRGGQLRDRARDLRCAARARSAGLDDHAGRPRGRDRGTGARRARRRDPPGLRHRGSPRRVSPVAWPSSPR